MLMIRILFFCIAGIGLAHAQDAPAPAPIATVEQRLSAMISNILLQNVQQAALIERLTSELADQKKLLEQMKPKPK